jgi:hypothetical protein
METIFSQELLIRSQILLEHFLLESKTTAIVKVPNLKWNINDS